MPKVRFAFPKRRETLEAATARLALLAGEVTRVSPRRRAAGPARAFTRVLIANRGEIALRIIRACRELGLESVAVYSDADAGAPHVAAADQAVRLGPAPATESYLRADLLIAAALATGAQAVHPGYGFLAEQAAFAEACLSAGLVFIGPSPATLAGLGDKLAARRTAREAGVPVVPGTLEPARFERPAERAHLAAMADEVGWPLLVKAAAGGGGRGMRLVTHPAELAAALVAASQEAQASFGDGSLYLERFVDGGRHIEVQLLGDATGTIVSLGERDCSAQRRNQKLLEEAPAPGLSPAEREHLGDLAVRVARTVGLQGAATCEFMRAADGSVWFLEVNVRLQVEHGVTELVTGLDLVHEQFRIAAGEPLSDRVLAAARRAATPERHAIEVRLSAEDPAALFAPQPGRLTAWHEPAGPGVRIDGWVGEGTVVPDAYDPLLAKLLVVAEDRPAALARMARALDEMAIGGLQTTLPFHRWLVREPAFVAGGISTEFVAHHWDGPARRAEAAAVALLAALAADDHDGRRGPLGRPAADQPVGPGRPPGSGRRVAAMTSPAGPRPRLATLVDGLVAGREGVAEAAREEVLVAAAAIGVPAPLVRRRPASPAEQAAGQVAWEVVVGGWRFEVLVEDAARAALRGRASRDAANAAGTTRLVVRALIAGRVVSVGVRDGEAVEAGQRLLSVEAMKMENEIRAQRAGRVERVAVEPGQRVERGDELAVLA